MLKVKIVSQGLWLDAYLWQMDQTKATQATSVIQHQLVQLSEVAQFKIGHRRWNAQFTEGITQKQLLKHPKKDG